MDMIENSMNIVAIGGGTGLSVILRGLKKITENLTAVVTVADDGGGSGILREDMGMLPPGDIRNCILALANKEPALQELFDYRFSEGRLSGQSFGNLMIAAMLGIAGTFEDAVKRISDIFAITGEVYPASSQPANLKVQLKNGKYVLGESAIPQEAFRQQSPIQAIWTVPEDAKCTDAVLERVRDADIVILGPGSLFTSVIPPLLIGDLASAINESHAKIFYVSNLMTQMGETDGFSPSDHALAILKHTELRRIDHVVVNTAPLSEESRERYREAHSEQVVLTDRARSEIEMLGINVLEGEFIKVRKGYVVHDADAIAGLIVANFERMYRE